MLLNGASYPADYYNNLYKYIYLLYWARDYFFLAIKLFLKFILCLDCEGGGMKRPEQLLQISVFENLIPLMYLQKYSQFIAFQIRNETGVGGKKGVIIGAISKAMGVMPGVSDTLFLFPNAKCVFVEFKCLKSPETSPESLLKPKQKKFKGDIESFGFEYKIIAAENPDSALKQIYKILRENGVKI